MNLKRVCEIHKEEYRGGPVLLALGRDIRAEDNDALIYAADIAHKHKASLIVAISVFPLFQGATSRHYDFFYQGLQETEERLRALGIPLVLLFGREEEELEHFIKKEGVGFLVTDFLPLRFSKKWKAALKEKMSTPWYEVDAHNVVPAWLASDKQEFAARTIRPKLYNLLPDFLDKYDEVKAFHNKELLTSFPQINFEEAKKKTKMRQIEKGLFVGGESKAHDILRTFLNEKLCNYDKDRNDFTKRGQSNLSPYLSKGQISRRRVVLETLKKAGLPISEVLSADKNGSNGKEGSIAAFLEELIIRSELAENFCFYNDEYDKISGTAAWAKLALNKARSDKREYIYTKEELEGGKTHDELWNAAQNEMRMTGKMHGYMRMYWAKKILEWTENPEDALEIAIYLNDTYEQDGLDPNGYAGIMWSIAGLHDRAWFPRPIFSTIRYMARSGAEKKGDVLEYIKTWNKKN
jgi:deoxyribodipyrimidine photo-lyase